MVWHFPRRHPRREELPAPPVSPQGIAEAHYDPVSNLRAQYEDIIVAILERAQKKASKHTIGDDITVRMTKAERAQCDFPVLLEDPVFERAGDYGLSPKEAYHRTFTFTVTSTATPPPDVEP